MTFRLAGLYNNRRMSELSVNAVVNVDQGIYAHERECVTDRRQAGRPRYV